MDIRRAAKIKQWRYAKRLRSNSGGECEAPLNLAQKEDAVGDTFHITLCLQPKGKKIAKHFTFLKIGIKTGLVIRTVN